MTPPAKRPRGRPPGRKAYLQISLPPGLVAEIDEARGEWLERSEYVQQIIEARRAKCGACGRRTLARHDLGGKLVCTTCWRCETCADCGKAAALEELCVGPDDDTERFLCRECSS